MTIGPDRGVVALDLGDGEPPLKLWFKLGSFRKLSEKLDVEVRPGGTHELLDHLNARTVGAFLWAGRLWEDREVNADALQERAEWSGVPLFQICEKVVEAVWIGSVGHESYEKLKRLAKEQEPLEDEPEDPRRPATNGAGQRPSGSPSASSG